MAIFALAGRRAALRRRADVSALLPPVAVIDRGAGAAHDDAVAVLKERNAPCQRREGIGIAGDIHLPVAIAEGERRSLPHTDQKVVMPGEDQRQRECAFQPCESALRRLHRILALRQVMGDEMRDNFGIGLRDKAALVIFQFGLQRRVIFDDAVMDDGDTLRRMRVGVVFRRPAMCRPARMADAGRAGQCLFLQLGVEIAELSFGAAAFDMAVRKRRDAGRIIAAIFEAAQPLNQQGRDIVVAKNSDDAAHGPLLRFRRLTVSGADADRQSI